MIHQSSTISVPAPSQMPCHVAIIMDGNGRWATQRHLPRLAGHSRGVDSVRNVSEACIERGIKYLTLFAFSSENWRRPPDEVSFLMGLFAISLQREVSRMHANGIRLRVVGDLSMFDERIQEGVRRAEAKTAANTRLTLTIAANYGGRWDIMQATRKIAEKAAETGHVAMFGEADFACHLAMAYAPEPDLFIRTGGEQRISNFMLWQLAYAEFYFTDQFWPDFNAASLDLAIQSFRKRERRFGQTSQQVRGTIEAAEAAVSRSTGTLPL